MLILVYYSIIWMKEHILSIYMAINSGLWHKEMEISIIPCHLIRIRLPAIQSPFVCAFTVLSNFAEGYGFTLIRFVADNPGAWALHCHISWHMEAGLLMTILEGAGGKIDAMVANAPAQWNALCSG